jgi:hypothetical protein
MARNTNTIRSKGPYIQDEAYTTEAVTPGQILQIDASETVGLNLEPQVKLCAETDVYVERMFAVEDGLQGKTVDDDYDADTLVTYIIPHRGSCVNARVAVATYAAGDKLVQDGSGALIEASAVTPDVEVGATAGASGAMTLGVAQEAPASWEVGTLVTVDWDASGLKQRTAVAITAITATVVTLNGATGAGDTLPTSGAVVMTGAGVALATQYVATAMEALVVADEDADNLLRVRVI